MQPSGRFCLLASLTFIVCTALACPAMGAQPRLPQSSLAASPHVLETTSNPLASEPALTNQDVVDMTRAGLSSGVIEEKIVKGPCRFDTSAGALRALKAAGVTNSVLSVMIRSRGPSITRKTPRVWIGTGEERIFEVNRVTLEGGGVRGTTTDGDATRRTHSGYDDITRLMSERCPGITITSKLPDSDYAVTVERYHPGHLITSSNDFTVFRQNDSNLILSDKAKRLKDAIDQVCNAVLRDTALEETASTR
jgi:hypothetical protein